MKTTAYHCNPTAKTDRLPVVAGSFKRHEVRIPPDQIDNPIDTRFHAVDVSGYAWGLRGVLENLEALASTDPLTH